MRQIKFRGKRLDNGQWIVGDLLRNRGETFIAPDGIANPLATFEDFHVDPATVGQFTDLLDKNGKEIYEGDIIQVSHANDRYKCRNIDSIIGDVRWNEVSMCYDAKGQILTTLCAVDAFYNIEVIANIHANPELLKTE